VAVFRAWLRVLIVVLLVVAALWVFAQDSPPGPYSECRPDPTYGGC